MTARGYWVGILLLVSLVVVHSALAGPPSRDAIRRVQELLMERGYDPGAIDGQPGPRTREAIRAFQHAEGLPTTGEISENLTTRLKQVNSKPHATAIQSQGAPSPPGQPPNPVVKKLTDILRKEKDPKRRVEAVRRFGQNAEAVDGLITALADQHPDVRQAAAAALGALKAPKAVEPLIMTLNDKDRWVGAYAASALGRLQEPQALEPLKAFFWRQALIGDASKIQESTNTMGGTVRHIVVGPALSAAFALTSFGEEGVETLSTALRDAAPQVRRIATLGLALTAKDRPVDPFIAALKDTDALVRLYAVYGLEKQGTTKATELLRSLVATETDPVVQAKAQEILQQLEGRGSSAFDRGTGRLR